MRKTQLLPGHEVFSDWVRDVLNHMYDSTFLQNHQLMDLLLDEEGKKSPNRIQIFRRILLDAIQSFRPKPGIPAQSPDWRAFRILELRFIEGLNPGEAMAQLGVGKSQFFRDQSRVVNALIDNLWIRYQELYSQNDQEDDKGLIQEQLIRKETDRLLSSATLEVLDLQEILNELEPLFSAQAQLRNCQVLVRSFESEQMIQTDRVILRQALINLLTYALATTKNKIINFDCFSEENTSCIQISTLTITENRTSIPSTSDTNLLISTQLVTSMGGYFIQQESKGRWYAEIKLNSLQQKSLLMIDDNEGLINLFRRYLAGQGWKLYAASTGIEARRKLLEIKPAVIILDVMMPEEDGWEVLISLKKTPEAKDLPVIICSVVNEPQLAEKLGAAGYLAKPVRQDALLKTLAPYS